MSLDVSTNEFRDWMQQTQQLVADYLSDVHKKRVFSGVDAQAVLAGFQESLPQEPTSSEDILHQIKTHVLNTVTNSAGPRYFGYITGGGNQAAVLAEMIKATLNQNNLKWHSSPVSTELERLVMRWVAEFIGYSTHSAGVLLSGGSVANFNAMAVARTIKAPANVAEEGLYNHPPMSIYVSREGHSSFDKAIDMLGLGKKYLRKIPTNNDLSIDIKALEDTIRQDKDKGWHPICAIGVAGTTNNGAVDDLEAIAELCRKYSLWYHVDAAYGGPAAGIASKKALFRGMEKADSVVINPHKWLYVPFEAGGLLVKDPQHLRKTFSTIPDYLKSDKSENERTDLMEYNLPLTKEFKALKVWMTLKKYGAVQIRKTIQADIDKAKYLEKRIEETRGLQMMAPVPLSIVCFRYRPQGLSESKTDVLNDQLVEAIETDGRIFLTGTKINRKTALRVCFINHRTKKNDVDYLLEVVQEVGKQLHRQMEK